MEDYDRRRHSVTKLRLHLVFTTKYRRKVMTPEILAEVIGSFVGFPDGHHRCVDRQLVEGRIFSDDPSKASEHS